MILVHLKCEIIFVLSNCVFFWYCDINIHTFSIAPCKDITLNLLCFIIIVSLCAYRGDSVKLIFLSFAIVFKNDSRKNDKNYESNTEKKPWAYVKKTKTCVKCNIAKLEERVIEKSPILLSQY